MLKLASKGFLVRCDVCRAEERIEASTHAEAWDVLKRRAWAVRRKAFPIIHICPECPVEAPRENPD